MEALEELAAQRVADAIRAARDGIERDHQQAVLDRTGLDKKYLTSCYLDGVAWCWYGQRRTVQGTIGYHW